MNWWWRRRDHERQIQQEIAAHLQLEAEEQTEAGVGPEAAYFAAKRALGNQTLIKESVRETWGWTWLERLLQDLRYASRTFRRNPASTITALISLALGIGGTCAMFSVLYGVVIDPYVYKDADRIIVPTFSDLDSEGRRPVFSYKMSDFLEIQANSHAFESMVLTNTHTAVLNRGGLIQNVTILETTANFFNFFETLPIVGRTFAPGDVLQPQNPPLIAVIGFKLWKNQFNGDPSVVGRDMEVGHHVYKILGVMPPRFTWFDTDIYVPNSIRPDGQHFGEVFMRLRKGVPLTAADADLQALTERIAKESPKGYPKMPFRMHAETLQHWLIPILTGQLIILMAAVSFLLAIACANISVLLMSHSAARKKEITLRVALGASTPRLFRQLITETLLLTSAGCVLGILTALMAVPAILAAMPEVSIPHESEIKLNVPVLLFTVAISMIAGLFMGIILASNVAQNNVHNSSRGNTSARSAVSARTALVLIETALTTLLLIASGIAVRNLAGLYHARLGYDPRNVAVLDVFSGRHKEDSWQSRNSYFIRVHEALAAMPGVVGASESLTAVPPRIRFKSPLTISGVPEMNNTPAAVALVSNTYFDTLKIPLMGGRIFTKPEVAQASPVAVVDETLANQLSRRGRQAIGSIIQVPALNLKEDGVLTPPNQAPSFEIVGIVSSVANQGLRQRSRPTIYVPHTYALAPGVTFLLRTQGNPRMFETTIQRKLRSFVDSDQRVADFDTLEHILTLDSLSDSQSSATLFSIFAALALSISAAGLYSVISFNVSQRSQEFGIRMALGARWQQLVALILRPSLGVTVLGIAMGVFGSVAFGKLLAYYESGWQPFDPPTLAAVCALQLLMCSVATWIPTLRAVSVSPDVVLRSE